MSSIKFKDSGMFKGILAIKGEKGDTGSIADLGEVIAGLTEKTTPVDADKFVISDSADTNHEKKLSWSNIKATLKTYFDTLYNNYVHPTTAGNKHIPAGGSANQVLKYSSDGTAVWGTDNDTIYTHPVNHPASIITQDSSNRFVTDAEKAMWNGKQDALVEGTWTPNTSTWTTPATNQFATYVKVGKMVYISALFLGGVVQNFGEISGLPFNVGGHGICNFRLVSSTNGGAFGLFDTAINNKISSIAANTFTGQYWLLAGTYISST